MALSDKYPIDFMRDGCDNLGIETEMMNMPGIEINDAVYEARSAMSSAGYRVDDVAALLREVGLERAAKKLDGISEYLNQASKNLVEAYGEDMSNQLRHNEDMTGKLFLAAIQASTNRMSQDLAD